MGAVERPEPEDVDDVSTPPARPSTRARSRGPAARASRRNRSAGFCIGRRRRGSARNPDAPAHHGRPSRITAVAPATNAGLHVPGRSARGADTGAGDEAGLGGRGRFTRLSRPAPYAAGLDGPDGSRGEGDEEAGDGPRREPGETCVICAWGRSAVVCEWCGHLADEMDSRRRQKVAPKSGTSGAGGRVPDTHAKVCRAGL